MLNLDPEKLRTSSIPVATGWFLGACMEAKGKQHLWTQQKPEVLRALKEQAIIQSSESSNRIEGVTVAKDRLRPVVLGGSTPRDRSEEELAGYRKALDWIFTRKHPISFTPEVLLKLHALAQGGLSGDAGEWKKRDNEIVEILPNGERKIRFVPTTAEETPALVAKLCQNYRQTSGDEGIPPLLSVANFVFDFLCIHPFRDGNGRVSRLVTTLLLESNGFQVARFVSLERLVEENKEEYYRILALCSEGWHDGRNDIVPWWNYFFAVLRRAYKEFEEQVESTSGRNAKTDLAMQVILDQVGQFTLADLSAQLTSVSPQLIKKVLSDLKEAGRIRLKGRGRGAQWEIIR